MKKFVPTTLNGYPVYKCVGTDKDILGVVLGHTMKHKDGGWWYETPSVSVFGKKDTRKEAYDALVGIQRGTESK